ncbi:MAG: fumarylacetoacetate hydrolase family protein [Henriciella sp.]
MKLATLIDGSPDGRLAVVSSDLKSYVLAGALAPTLQSALDNWQTVRPELEAISAQLNAGETPATAFDERACESPLPRAYQWLDGSAYINHVELVRKARDAEMPPAFYDDPLMYQGNSDANLRPYQAIPHGGADWGVDMEGEIAVITDHVPAGISEAEASDHIKLVMLCNDVSLRGLIPAELGKGFGFVHSKPACAFSPVCVTPDELGPYWDDDRLQLPLHVDYNGMPFGRPHAGQDATFSMARLIAHAAKTRQLSPGTIVGSGTVSNKDEDGGPGRPVAAGGRGYSCIAELRMIETILDGQPSTPFMSPGDRVRIEVFAPNGQSIFGAIEQSVIAI